MEIYLSKTERFSQLEVDSSISIKVDTDNEKDIAFAEKRIYEFYIMKNVDADNK